jgi:hypothetical protein
MVYSNLKIDLKMKILEEYTLLICSLLFLLDALKTSLYILHTIGLACVFKMNFQHIVFSDFGF